MATLATVTGLARLILDDVDADVFTDTILLGYVNAAYRDMWLRLNGHGVKQTIKTTAAVAVNLSTVEQNLTLPTPFIAPLQLWEKGSTETDDNYIEMVLVDDLSTDPATTTIGQWKWENGNVVLRPVNNNRSVRMQYSTSFVDLAAPTDPVYPPFAENYLAYATAALAARSRDQADFARDLAALAAGSLNQLIGDQVRANQRKLSRPTPYSRR